MIKTEDGFSTPLALMVTFSLFLIICCLSMYVYVAQKKIEAYRTMNQERKSVKILLNNFENDLQSFASCNCDTFSNVEYMELIEKYSIYNVKMYDVSTGINTEFLSSNFLENIEINRLLQIYGDSIKVDYGWLNPKYSNPVLLDSVKKDLKNKIYPVINSMSLFNIYCMNLDFISAILKYCNIEDADEKAVLLFEKLISSDIDSETLCNILSISSSNKFFELVGTKTNFWKVELENNKTFIEAYFAAIPKNGNNNGIEKYSLIDFTSVYKESN